MTDLSHYGIYYIHFVTGMMLKVNKWFKVTNLNCDITRWNIAPNIHIAIDEKKQYPRILWIVVADWSIMAINIMNSTVAELFLFYFCFVLLFSSPLEAKRKAIEEIPRRQLDTLITTEDYLAVFWRKSLILYIAE